MTQVGLHTSGRNLIGTNLDTRWGIFKFKHAAMGFLLGVFFFPSYFGINVGFDLTVLRIFEIILFVMIYQNKIRLSQFISLIKGCKQNIFILPYFIVVCYTNVLRGFAINGILYTFFNWICVFYLTFYLIKYEWGVTKFIKYLKTIVTAVCIISVLELVVGFPPFSIFDTLGKSSTNSRFGAVRIMGNCTTPNGFGLYLMLLMPICAYDEQNNRIDILKNKLPVLLTVVCGFLTGSRLAAGAAVLELILLIVVSPKGLRGKVIFYGSAFVITIFGIAFALQNISFFKSILLTFFSAVDEVLGTEIAVQYGADPTVLYNSSFYRELLWQAVFFDSWLNPWLGQGADYQFTYWYDSNYALGSVDNYYVGQYITYAYPGLITWLLMSASFVPHIIKKYRRKDSCVNIAILISFIGYFISLWYLDQLGTFPVMMALFALSCVDENKERRATK